MIGFFPFFLASFLLVLPKCRIQNGEDDFVVLGNAFIKNHAVTFDYGDSSLKNRRIGVANRRDTGIVVDIDGNIIAVGSRDKPLQFLPLNLY